MADFSCLLALISSLRPFHYLLDERTEIYMACLKTNHLHRLFPFHNHSPVLSEMKGVVVLYPSPGMGHLVSMVEFGKFILKHHPTFSIIIFVVTPPYNTGSTAAFIARVSSTTPSITFHHFPSISLPLNSFSSPNHETLTFELLRLNDHNVHQALLSISNNSTVSALIIDFFCTSALSVASELSIPCYYFFTSSANCLACFAYLHTIHQNTSKSFKELNADIHIPGLPPIPASDMAKPILDRTGKAYEFFLDMSLHLPKSAGIIVNTFEVLEDRALKAISDGLCVPHSPTPPIFCIGPLIVADDRLGRDMPECLTWLDSQPKRSVLFLCFGSLGLFSAEQLKEIAIGLERSGQRFLWVVRSPPNEDQSKRFLAPPDPDLDLLLPDGFLDRTKERGLVVKSWAPQVAVLNHESVGGFVTHCGWNSFLEGLCAGVPMLAWPLYAEQRFNKVILVEEKLALPMEELEDGFVKASEIEKRARQLMESEEGKLIRNQIMVMKEAAEAAMSVGGSSRVALMKLVQSWK